MMSAEFMAEVIRKVTGADPELSSGFIALSVQPGQVLRSLALLKKRLGFEFLTDLIVVRRTGCQKHFTVTVLMTSPLHRVTAGLQVEVSKNEELDSLKPIYPSSKAFEKKATERFGLVFR